MELEWVNEYDNIGSKFLTLSVMYQPDGSYLIEVLSYSLYSMALDHYFFCLKEIPPILTFP